MDMKTVSPRFKDHWALKRHIKKIGIEREKDMQKAAPFSTSELSELVYCGKYSLPWGCSARFHTMLCLDGIANG